MDKLDVTRVELITKEWRQYVNMNVKSCELSYQDNNRTLKIFVDREQPQIEKLEPLQLQKETAKLCWWIGISTTWTSEQWKINELIEAVNLLLSKQ